MRPKLQASVLEAGPEVIGFVSFPEADNLKRDSEQEACLGTLSIAPSASPCTAELTKLHGACCRASLFRGGTDLQRLN